MRWNGGASPPGEPPRAISKNRISRLKAAVVYFPAFLEKGIVKEKLIFDIGGDGSSWRDCAAFCHWVRPEDPHGCGENCVTIAARTELIGTSPRVWGKPTRPHATPAANRNIPTGVGKTCINNSSRLQTPEHPHGCGENFIRPQRGRKKRGTSPRVWGKQTLLIVDEFHQRNIPTGVGKTPRFPPLCQRRTEHPHGCGENKGRRAGRDVEDGTSPRVWGKR